jgi:hypothetical protein
MLQELESILCYIKYLCHIFSRFPFGQSSNYIIIYQSSTESALNGLVTKPGLYECSYTLRNWLHEEDT